MFLGCVTDSGGNYRDFRLASFLDLAVSAEISEALYLDTLAATVKYVIFKLGIHNNIITTYDSNIAQ